MSEIYEIKHQTHDLELICHVELWDYDTYELDAIFLKEHDITEFILGLEEDSGKELIDRDEIFSEALEMAKNDAAEAKAEARISNMVDYNQWRYS